MNRYPVCLVLALGIACSSSSGSGSTTTPSTPPLAPTSETFSGTVAVGGSDVHPFTVNLSNGQVTATLTAAAPPATIAMGLGIGTYSSGTCTLLTNGYVVTPASTVAQLAGSGFTSGTYCVAVFDAGNQLAEVTYSVTVTHY
jgi:hypothetical protein